MALSKQKLGLAHINVRGFSLLSLLVVLMHNIVLPSILVCTQKTSSILSVGTKQSEYIAMLKLVEVWTYIYQDTCKRPF